MTKPLQNKVALVTGGSRGIGAAIAKRLAADGAVVAITYGKSKDKAEQVVAEITKAGGKAVAILGDALKPETMQAVVDATVKQLGRLDILVNNAGILEGGGNIGDIDIEALQRTLDVNVKSLFTLTQAAAKVLPDNSGRIINLSSVLGERAIFPSMSVYTASKFAVTGLTRGWALDLAPRNITVNAVLPGPIATDMAPGDLSEMVPLKRMGKAEDIAHAVAFFASPESSFVTGAELRVDGGVNA